MALWISTLRGKASKCNKRKTKIYQSLKFRNEGRNKGKGIACGSLLLHSTRFDFVVYRFLV